MTGSSLVLAGQFRQVAAEAVEGRGLDLLFPLPPLGRSVLSRIPCCAPTD